MMLLISQRSSVRRAAMHASAYEVGLRDVFEEDEACSPIFTFSNPNT